MDIESYENIWKILFVIGFIIYALAFDYELHYMIHGLILFSYGFALIVLPDYPYRGGVAILLFFSYSIAHIIKRKKRTGKYFSNFSHLSNI